MGTEVRFRREPPWRESDLPREHCQCPCSGNLCTSLRLYGSVTPCPNRATQEDLLCDECRTFTGMTREEHIAAILSGDAREHCHISHLLRADLP